MSSPFASPGSPSEGIQWDQHKGDLLLIHVHSVEYGIQTTFGEKQAVRADVVALGNGQPVEYLDTLIFPKVLISQLRGTVGNKVLGRLGQGTAKSGQKPPWLLEDATAADIEKGNAYLGGTLTTVGAATEDAPPF